MPTDSRELLAVGLFGHAPLSGRIEILLKRGREFSPRASLLRIAATAAMLLVLAVASSLAPRWIAFAQRLEFEVASVKPNISGQQGRFIRPSPGQLSITNMSLKNLLTIAYKVRDFQISGGPGWMDSDRYDIEAKPAANASPKQMEGPMLQALLEDRFSLHIHHETRELPVYVLTVGKNGSNLSPAAEKTCVPFDPSNPPLPTAPNRNPSEQCGFLGLGLGSLTARQVSMEALTMAFSQLLGRPVVDRTGITGEVDARLTFAPDEAPTSDSTLPSIFTAVQEQLGLKLDSAKGPVDILVVDRAEKPTGN